MKHQKDPVVWSDEACQKRVLKAQADGDSYSDLMLKVIGYLSDEYKQSRITFQYAMGCIDGITEAWQQNVSYDIHFDARWVEKFAKEERNAKGH